MEYNVLNYPQKDIDRFWSKVNIIRNPDGSVNFDECMEWLYGKFSDGYGQFHIFGNNIRAHRFSYMCFNGIITSEQYVCHTCDNPICVNPYHFFIGDAELNSKDMVLKNRSLTGSSNPNCILSDGDVLKIINNIESGKYIDLADISNDWNISQRRLRSILNGSRLNHIDPQSLKMIRIKILNLSRPGESNGNSKLLDRDVYEIRELLPYHTNVELGKMFGVSRSTISNIRSNKLWKHI